MPLNYLWTSQPPFPDMRPQVCRPYLGLRHSIWQRQKIPLAYGPPGFPFAVKRPCRTDLEDIRSLFVKMDDIETLIDMIIHRHN